MSNSALKASLAAIVIVAGVVSPAWAGMMTVPAPIVGAGLPVLLVAAGAYWAVKVIRNRRKH